MSRYIDRDAVRRAIQEYCCIQEEITPDGIAKVVMSVPTVDVVEVVRCRDCQHNRDNGGDCDRTIILNEYDSTEYRCAGLEYCSYGERSEK